MSITELKNFIDEFIKNRLTLYGITAGLIALLILTIGEIRKESAKLNIVATKEVKKTISIPLDKAELLFNDRIDNLLMTSTNVLSPFYTDRFKPVTEPTNTPPPPPPPPPPTLKFHVKYLGLIQNSSGLKQGFFLVNSNLVSTTNSGRIYTNIVVVDFNLKEAKILCQEKTNIIPFNKECEFEIPQK